MGSRPTTNDKGATGNPQKGTPCSLRMPGFSWFPENKKHKGFHATKQLFVLKMVLFCRCLVKPPNQGGNPNTTLFPQNCGSVPRKSLLSLQFPLQTTAKPRRTPNKGTISYSSQQKALIGRSTSPIGEMQRGLKNMSTNSITSLARLQKICIFFRTRPRHHSKCRLRFFCGLLFFLLPLNKSTPSA